MVSALYVMAMQISLHGFGSGFYESDTHTALSVVAMATLFHFDIPKAILPSSYQPLMMELLHG